MRLFLVAVAILTAACTPTPPNCTVCCIIRDGDTVREVVCP